MKRKETEAVLKEIKKQIEQFHMLERGDRILIGLSGGADSVCLTQVLFELSKEYNLHLGAVSCHHGLRGEEADEDVRFAENFCRERHICFYKTYEDIEVRALRDKISVEEAGREYRYEVFRRIMKEQGYNKLAVAHNADDRAETMLFHLTRGTGVAGLCTMEPVRDFFEGRKLIRPLLWQKKAEIEKWLQGKSVSWRVDRTNEEDNYTRNRIRHRVIPELSAINDRAVEHMGEAAEQIGEICSYLKEEEDSIFKKAAKKEKERLVISVPLLKEVHIYMKKAFLYRSLCELAESRKDITSGHVKILLDLVEGPTGREAHFMKGIRGRKEYDSVILCKDSREPVENMEKKSEDFFKRIELSMEKYPYTGQEISKNEYTKHFDCDKIQSKLCLRFWKEGDFFYLREDGGKKKLNRYFIDHKIPVDERDQILLLADGSHILWIVGHRISAYYKVTDSTKNILEVTIKNKG